MNIAIYIKDDVDIKQIKIIKEYFLKENYTSIVFIANENIIQNNSLSDIASINASNISWFDGSIVFMSIDNYLSVKNDIIGKPIIVLNNKNLISNLTPEIIKESTLLLITNNKIRKVKNAELQSIIR